jgi:hypothetical protein
MNKNNINLNNAKKILSWCKKEYGKSKFYKKYPKLYLYRIPWEPKDYGYFLIDFNEIILFKKPHNTFVEFIDTIIHEYIHYLQDQTKYDKLLPKGKNNYKNHPFEKESYSIASRDKFKCKKELFSKPNKK